MNKRGERQGGERKRAREGELAERKESEKKE
jgi:hypothetical protein